MLVRPLHLPCHPNLPSSLLSCNIALADCCSITVCPVRAGSWRWLSLTTRLGKQLRKACCKINGILPWTQEKPIYKTNADYVDAAERGDAHMSEGEMHALKAYQNAACMPIADTAGIAPGFIVTMPLADRPTSNAQHSVKQTGVQASHPFSKLPYWNETLVRRTLSAAPLRAALVPACHISCR
jgi:hypothetical protein